MSVCYWDISGFFFIFGIKLFLQSASEASIAEKQTSFHFHLPWALLSICKLVEFSFFTWIPTSFDPHKSYLGLPLLDLRSIFPSIIMVVRVVFHMWCHTHLFFSVFMVGFHIVRLYRSSYSAPPHLTPFLPKIFWITFASTNFRKPLFCSPSILLCPVQIIFINDNLLYSV